MIKLQDAILSLLAIAVLALITSPSFSFGQNTIPTDNFKANIMTPIANTTPQALGTAVAAKSYCINSLAIGNMHATQATSVVLYDGAAPLWHCPAAPVGGGCTQVFVPPLCGTNNTALNVATDDAASVKVSVKGRLSGQ